MIIGDKTHEQKEKIEHMSYYKLKQISMNKEKNVIKLTLYPLHYITSEFASGMDMDFRMKIEIFLVSCLRGNFHPTPGCKIRGTDININDVIKEMEFYQKKAQKIVHERYGKGIFELNLDYHLENSKKVERIVATHVGYYECMKIPYEKTYEELCSIMENFAEEAILTIEKVLEDDKKQKKIRINTAWMCNTIPNRVLLVTNDEEVLIAPEENYKAGVLSNADDRSIPFGKYSSTLVNILLGYSTLRNRNEMLADEKERMAIEQIEKTVQAYKMKFVTPLYVGFAA